MGKLIDLTGRVFGKLTVISFERVPVGRAYKIKWLCSCDCGNFCSPTSQALREGYSTSCGCSIVEGARKMGVSNRLEPGVSGRNYLYSNYKSRAFKKNRDFTISENYFFKLTLESCHYCGCQPSQVIAPNPHGAYTYNGIDRIDSSKGYTEENCVPCCKICNRAKLDMDYKQFVEWIERVRDSSTKELL